MSHEASAILSSELFRRVDRIHPRVLAKQLDKYLGYRISKVEMKLLQRYRAYDSGEDVSNRKKHYQGTQTWVGLHPQVLQTPYCDIYDALSLLQVQDIYHVVDIGAGYGRVGLVLNALNSDAHFTGFEIVRQRQQEGNRIYAKLGIDNCQIKLQNVLDNDFDLPTADVYFIYDFSEREDVEHILQILRLRSKTQKFYLITRGDRVDFAIKHRFKHVWKSFAHLGTSDLKIYTT